MKADIDAFLDYL